MDKAVVTIGTWDNPDSCDDVVAGDSDSAPYGWPCGGFGQTVDDAVFNI